MPKKKTIRKTKQTKTIKIKTKQPKIKITKTKKPRLKSVKTKSIKTKSIKTKPEVKVTKAKKTAPTTFRDKKLLEIKKKLITRKESLLAEAEEALNELPGQTMFPDLGDQATAETERSFMLRLRGRERRLLKKIDEAIERIESGVFGICDKCGMEIDIRRLEVRPVTTLCIECKIQQEEEERLTEK
ncbi:MAG TPA: RNA polymerase-binding protein DksA [Thermodesulfovibrionales bacterium]|nr:RNA polymerase-binding protein DksA [Thermodesulfovibrionales bacterium]